MSEERPTVKMPTSGGGERGEGRAVPSPIFSATISGWEEEGGREGGREGGKERERERENREGGNSSSFDVVCIFERCNSFRGNV